MRSLQLGFIYKLQSKDKLKSSSISTYDMWVKLVDHGSVPTPILQLGLNAFDIPDRGVVLDISA